MEGNSEKYKYLATNIGLLTLSSFATKLLSFFLVPLYTNILSTTEYGINDLFYSTAGILVPVLTLNIQDSVMRFAMDKKYEKKMVLAVGIRYLINGAFIVLTGLIINYIFEVQTLFKTYAAYFFLIFLSQALSGLILAYIRGTNRIADLSVSSIINSVVIICCNILFLVVFKWGLIGYFLANIIGPFLQCIFLILRAHVIRDANLFYGDKTVSREMTAYSRPLIANAIGWWINNAFDKYIVIYSLGMAENGIYSVAGKIPSILNIFQTIFAQAWTLSAVKDYDPEDKNGFFAKTYAMYNCLMTVVCSALIVGDKILARVLYAKEFYAAWKYVPWLTIAILFGSLTGYLGGFFSAVKDSKHVARSTLIGSVCNIILNFCLTPVIGAMGAAIATAVSYFAVWIIRLLQSKKYIKLKINLSRDFAAYIGLVIQAFILLLLDGIFLYGTEILLFIIILLMYIRDIHLVIAKIKNTVIK